MYTTRTNASTADLSLCVDLVIGHTSLNGHLNKIGSCSEPHEVLDSLSEELPNLLLEETGDVHVCQYSLSI